MILYNVIFARNKILLIIFALKFESFIIIQYAKVVGNSNTEIDGHRRKCRVTSL
jgi:hypothetical protein